jgi:hypothetical protein
MAAAPRLGPLPLETDRSSLIPSLWLGMRREALPLETNESFVLQSPGLSPRLFRN